MADKMDVEQTLIAWDGSLCPEIAVESLLKRNQIAQKWKAMFRSITLRETLFYRSHDLLTQSLDLHQKTHTLGARILLRSAFEATAVLIYLNQMTDKVLKGDLDFHEFGLKTAMLLTGSKDGSTELANVNIVTVLKHADKRYEGILKLYGILSETAHPSFEGMMRGYVAIDHDEMVAKFSNCWHERYGDGHLHMMETCMLTLDHEYNKIWPDLYEQLEKFLEQNDERLEATKATVAN
jgi:hypothetical protein